jgi:hypothetical protein
MSPARAWPICIGQSDSFFFGNLRVPKRQPVNIVCNDELEGATGVGNDADKLGGRVLGANVSADTGAQWMSC